ncbi:MAG: ADP-ribosylglycohydrolase family protein [Deltaproteobacteria bacterium]|nr:ADP-ribosylglycohydrolase family protein [Deltaproteobacteria bacterium]
MWGAIAGDIIGQPWEGNASPSDAWGSRPPLVLRGSHFTDDTVLTVAVAKILLDGDRPEDALKAAWRAHPRAGYGFLFRKWCAGELDRAYRSYGNGGAMRVSPTAWAFDDINEVLDAAERVTIPTHAHVRGLAGAWAIAGATYIARVGGTKREIAEFCEHLGYDLIVDLDAMHRRETFATADATVPAALRAFLDTDSFESAVLEAVQYGGDTDTVAAMAGSIGEAFYRGVPNEILEQVIPRLAPDLLEVAVRFTETQMRPRGFYLDGLPR